MLIINNLKQKKTSSENNKLIVKNTIILYFRMLFTMGVSLYTSRVVLNVLGVIDFGIYNIVGGLVTTFALFNSSLSSASQRFITFEMGKGDSKKLKETFSVVVTIHVLIAIIIFIVAESIGLWFLNTHMNIDSYRMDAAKWVYQCSLLAFLIGVISVPYNALIIAHEKMAAFAYIGIIEIILKLLIVYMLMINNYDKLKLYAVLILLISVIIRLVYGYYCKKNFYECKIRMSWNGELFRRIASFAGWNFIGAGSAVLMGQGVNILLNIFYGVVVNAAQGIAGQIQSAVGGFVGNFMVALNPQITKSYARNDRDQMMRLVIQGARFSFYLMLFLSLPILFETQNILMLWLKIVPDYTVIFVRLSLIFTICQTFSNTLITAMLATGNIKKYQIIVGGLQMLNFPMSFIFLQLGFPPQSTLVIAIGLSFACLFTRLYLLHDMIKLPVTYYIRHVLINVMIVTALSAILPLLIYSNMKSGLFRLGVVCSVCSLSTAAVIYGFGFSKKERLFINNKIIFFLREKYGLI